MWKTLLTVGLGNESHTLETLNSYHARWLARRWMRLTYHHGGYLICTQWHNAEVQ